MVQRGYETSRKVLFGFSRQNFPLFPSGVHSYCHLMTRDPLVENEGAVILRSCRATVILTATGSTKVQQPRPLGQVSASLSGEASRAASHISVFCKSSSKTKSP